MIRTTCPNCQTSIKVRPELAGRAVLCPKCKGKFQIPAEAPVEAVAVEEPVAPPLQPTPPIVINTGPRVTQSARPTVKPLTIVALGILTVVVGLPCLCAGLVILGGGGEVGNDAGGGGGGFNFVNDSEPDELDPDEPGPMPGLAKWNHGREAGLQDGSKILSGAGGMAQWSVTYDDAGRQMRQSIATSGMGHADPYWQYMAGYRAGMREARKKAGR